MADNDQQYPPDPHWGRDNRGQFRYMDYDGESLRIYRNPEGDLWIDKHGEGPVFIRQQDIPLILDAINDPRTPRDFRRSTNPRAFRSIKEKD